MESIFKLGIMMSIVDAVSGPANNIGRSMDGLRGRVAALGPVFNRFKRYGAVMLAFGVVAVHVLSGAVTATAATQAALGEMASVGVRDLGALESAAADFSNTWSGTTKAQFVGAAYDIKSGISSLSDVGVAEFTKLAALTGKATKSTTAEMTSLFATGYGIYKGAYGQMSDLRFGEMFSAGIAGSVKQFKTTGSGMAQAISQLGAAATSAKVPLEEQLSVLGMLQATMSGSEAGTKYTMMIAGAAQAGDKLGLSFMDANHQLLGMPEILTVLRDKFGETLDAAEKVDITKAFGSQEAVAVIDLLYGKVGDLTGNIANLSGAMRQGTDFTVQMAAAMNQDIGAGVKLVGQRWHNLVEVIGKQLIPVLALLFGWFGKVLVVMQKFTAQHPFLTRVLVVGIAAMALFAAAIGGLITVISAVGLLMPNFMAGIAGIGSAITAAGGGFGVLKAKILGAIPALRGWLLWQKENVLWFLYQRGGVLAYAKSLATAPVDAAKRAAVAAWGYVTGLTAQFAATVAAAGGVRAYGLSLLSSAVPAMVAATAGAWAFTVALLANPLTWIVLAVVALGAALYFLVRWLLDLKVSWSALWDKALVLLAPVTDALGEVWEAASMIAAPFKQIWASISGVSGAITGSTRFAAVLYAVGEVIGFVLKWGIKLVAWVIAMPIYIVAMAGKIIGAILSIPGALGTVAGWFTVQFDGLMAIFKNAGGGLWKAFTAGIKGAVMMPINAVKSGLHYIRNMLPFSDAKEGPLSSLTLSGQRLMETIGAGVKIAAPGLRSAVAGALVGVAVAMPPGVATTAAAGGNNTASSGLAAGKAVMAQTAKMAVRPELSGGVVAPAVPDVSMAVRPELSGGVAAPAVPDVSMAVRPELSGGVAADSTVPDVKKLAEGSSARKVEMHFHGDLSFPNVRSSEDAEGLLGKLMHLVAEVDGDETV